MGGWVGGGGGSEMMFFNFLCPNIKCVGLSEIVVESLPDSDNFQSDYFLLYNINANVQNRHHNFVVTLGIAEILGLSDFSVYTEVVLLKTFPQHFELCLFCKY